MVGPEDYLALSSQLKSQTDIAEHPLECACYS